MAALSPRSRTRPALLTLAALCLIGSLASADPVSDFEARRLSLRVDRDRQTAALPSLGQGEEHQLSDLFLVQMERRNLRLRTTLESTLVPGFAKTRVPGFAEPVLVRVVGGADRNRPGPIDAVLPRELLLQIADYSTPRRITLLSLSQTGDAQFSLSQTETSPVGSRNVQLVVDDTPFSPARGGVTLIVRIIASARGEPQVNLRLREEDCRSLFAEHPREVADYLSPLLAEIGQDQVLAPERELVLQVFADKFPVDSAVRKRLGAILPELNASDYHRRDEAGSQLQMLGGDAVAVLARQDRARLTPEQNMRIDAAMSRFGLVAQSDAQRLRRDEQFLLNCLFREDAETRQLAICELDSLTGRSIALPDTLTRQERIAAIEKLRTSLTVAR